MIQSVWNNKIKVIPVQRDIIVQGLLLSIYKIALDYSFVYYLSVFDSSYYHLDINPAKYFLSWIVLFILYFLINIIKEEDSAKFLLNLVFQMGVIPFTTIFAFENQSTLCFGCVCMMFGLIAFVVDCIKPKGLQIREIQSFRQYHTVYLVSIVGSGLLLLVLAIYVLLHCGIPSFKAMDLLQIYKTIRSESFIENKYIGYLHRIVILVIAPYLLAVFYENKKFFFFAIIIIYLFVLFLYSGNKTTLFSIGIFVGLAFFRTVSKKDSTIINTISLGLILSCMTWIASGKYIIYSFLIRRVLLVPAHLKFIHYEYFCNNEKLGMAGTVIGKAFGIHQYNNEGVVIKETFASAIGRIIGKEGMNCNTGFLIEGFDRFGYIGFLFIGLAFIVLLLAIRKYETNNSHSMALFTSTYFIYALNDGFLFGSAELSLIVLLIMTVIIRSSGREVKYDE